MHLVSLALANLHTNTTDALDFDDGAHLYLGNKVLRIVNK